MIFHSHHPLIPNPTSMAAADTITPELTPAPSPIAPAQPQGGEFFSAFGFNDNVEFHPMYRHSKALGISSEAREGRVVAVRFTEMKVWYDIFDLYTGTIFENVDSGKVYAPSFTPLPQPLPEVSEAVES